MWVRKTTVPSPSPSSAAFPGHGHSLECLDVSPEFSELTHSIHVLVLSHLITITRVPHTSFSWWRINVAVQKTIRELIPRRFLTRRDWGNQLVTWKRGKKDHPPPLLKIWFDDDVDVRRSYDWQRNARGKRGRSSYGWKESLRTHGWMERRADGRMNGPGEVRSTERKRGD